MPSPQAAQEKIEEVEELKELMHQYNVVGAASLAKVRAAQLQELRKKLEKSAFLRVTKNTITKRAITQCEDKPELKKLEEHLSGPNILLFTNLNPFKLALLLKKSKVKTTAKAGDTAADDVTVPAGNTGMPPGPIISQLNSVGLPTRIESGSVWIIRDTKVAKKGEIIDMRLASVLSKLGIKPVEAGLTIKAAYDNGLIITQEQMELNLEETKRNIGEAHAQAFNLSIDAAYPLPENINPLLQTAHQEAYRLALNADIYTSDTIADLIRKAHVEMLSLNAKLSKKD
jgi:large subunit ribosomal protein L10